MLKWNQLFCMHLMGNCFLIHFAQCNKTALSPFLCFVLIDQVGFEFYSLKRFQYFFADINFTNEEKQKNKQKIHVHSRNFFEILLSNPSFLGLTYDNDE